MMDKAAILEWLPGEAQGWLQRFAPLWNEPVEVETQRGRVAIVGQPGAGKKTLCNSLWGWEAVAGSEERVRHFGLFLLIDLPADPADAENTLYRLEDAELILYVLDASQGLQPADFNWIARLRALKATLLVVANKIDQLDKPGLTQTLVVLETRLARPILPLTARDRAGVQGDFLQAVVKACPTLAEPLATEIAALRRRVARQLILRGMISGVTMTLEAPSEQDESVLTAIQLRLIRRIGALYGYKDHAQPVRELLISNFLRFLLRGLVLLAGRFPRVREWMVSGVIAVVTTFLVGQAALAYYGGELPVSVRGHGLLRSG
jgi:ethanolamine utilization protein EutP (predicted NTPase)